MDLDVDLVVDVDVVVVVEAEPHRRFAAGLPHCGEDRKTRHRSATGAA